MPKETYLGDGVHAVFDGYAITLDLRAQDDVTKIVIEPEVMESLIAFFVKCRSEGDP